MSLVFTSPFYYFKSQWIRRRADWSFNLTVYCRPWAFKTISKPVMSISQPSNLNNIVAQMPFTTQFSQMAYSIYHLKRVSGETTFQTMFTVVQFDLKPLSRNGVVWVLLSTPISKVCTNVKGLSKKLPNFLVLWLTNFVKMVWIQRFSSCFRPMLPLYPLKALGNRRFSCVFRGCKMVILAWMS